MRNIICLLAVATCLAACHPRKQMTATPVVVHNSDSIKTEYIETVRIDTVTVEVVLPTESVMNTARDSVSHIETSLAVSDAWINADGTLSHFLQNKDNALTVDVLVPNKTTVSNNVSASIKEVPVPYPVTEYVQRDFTKWEKFKLGIFWYLIGISVLSVGYNFRKKIFMCLGRIFSM